MTLHTETSIKFRNKIKTDDHGRSGRPHAILSRSDYRRIVAELLG